MKLKILFAILTAGLLRTVSAAETNQPAVILIDHAKVAATYAKGGSLLANNEFKVSAGRRDAPGPVELHERDTDIFYILEGSATFITGGKIVEPTTISPGEIHGKEIIGGEPQHLVKGDVIIIPRGVPHWFKEVSGPFLYHVVKVTK